MAIAGYNSLVSCATGAAATQSTMNGIKTFKIGDSRDQLDITDFADGNVRARLAALRDIQVDISGDYEPSDTGWAKLLACYEAGNDVALALYTRATATTVGVGYLLQVSSIDINSAADGKAEVSVSLLINSSSGTHAFALP